MGTMGLMEIFGMYGLGSMASIYIFWRVVRRFFRISFKLRMALLLSALGIAAGYFKLETTCKATDMASLQILLGTPVCAVSAFTGLSAFSVVMQRLPKFMAVGLTTSMFGAFSGSTSAYYAKQYVDNTILDSAQIRQFANLPFKHFSWYALPIVNKTDAPEDVLRDMFGRFQNDSAVRNAILYNPGVPCDIWKQNVADKLKPEDLAKWQQQITRCLKV
ncbi:MAG: hypothetical protein EB060_04325 [Proteobacteria bacterium]|nr:hypothetical protein [Pseudomonadota bacterium]